MTRGGSVPMIVAAGYLSKTLRRRPIPVTGSGLAGGAFGGALRLVTAGLLARRRGPKR